MCLFSVRRLSFLCGAVLIAAACQSAQAGMITTTSDFTVSNEFSDGPSASYGTVAVRHWDGTGSNDGTITFTVTPSTSLYSSLSNFGIQKFGFNFSNVTLTAGQFSLPSGWSVSLGSSNLSQFGLFEATPTGNGGTRQNPLAFTISGLGNLNTYANFHDLSTSPSTTGSAAYYVAHIAGFTKSGTTKTSHWVGDNGTVVVNSVPEPTSLALLATGALGTVVIGRRRRRQTA